MAAWAVSGFSPQVEERDILPWDVSGLYKFRFVCLCTTHTYIYGGSPLGGTRWAQARGAPGGGTSSPGTSSGGTRSLAQGQSRSFKVAICPELSVMTIYCFLLIKSAFQWALNYTRHTETLQTFEKVNIWSCKSLQTSNNWDAKRCRHPSDSEVSDAKR